MLDYLFHILENLQIVCLLVTSFQSLSDSSHFFLRRTVAITSVQPKIIKAVSPQKDSQRSCTCKAFFPMGVTNSRVVSGDWVLSRFSVQPTVYPLALRDLHPSHTLSPLPMLSSPKSESITTSSLRSYPTPSSLNVPSLLI